MDPEKLDPFEFGIGAYFTELRFNSDHHLGSGDIRLTIAQQKEIMEYCKKLDEKRRIKMKERAEPNPNKFLFTIFAYNFKGPRPSMKTKVKVQLIATSEQSAIDKAMVIVKREEYKAIEAIQMDLM